MRANRDQLLTETAEIILSALREVKQQMGKDGNFEVSLKTRLYGRGSDLDSMGLVQLVVDVEEKIGERYGVPVTLTDEKALSQEHSPFQTAEALANYVTKLLLQKETSHVE